MLAGLTAAQQIGQAVPSHPLVRLSKGVLSVHGDFRMTSSSQKPCRTYLNRALNTAQAAEMLGVQPATLRGWKSQRIGPPFIQLSPRCVRYSESDILRYADERRVVPCVRDTERPHAAL